MKLKTSIQRIDHFECTYLEDIDLPAPGKYEWICGRRFIPTPVLSGKDWETLK